VEGQRTTLIFRLASNCHAPFGSSLTVWPIPDGTALASGFGYANVTVGETSTSAAVNLTDGALSLPVPVDWLPGMAYTAVVVLNAPPPQARGQVLSVWMCDKSQTAVSNSSQNGTRIYCSTTASGPLVPASPLLAAAPISGSTSVLRGDDAFSWDAAVVNYACPSPGCDNRLDLQMRPVVDIPKVRTFDFARNSKEPHLSSQWHQRRQELMQMTRVFLSAPLFMRVESDVDGLTFESRHNCRAAL
jgi:hypothetical protein